MNVDPGPSRPTAVGCVSFLNASPLIDSLDGDPRLSIHYDVPSRLLGDLLARRVHLALCPVVDYQLSPTPLAIVPVGGIGCDGPTLTVRLFSRVPWDRVQRLHADTHSHTSVVLARLVLAERYGVRPDVVDLEAGAASPSDLPETVLLIGDKVVTNAPPRGRFAFELDLGEEWKRLTCMPFVFAIWMSLPGADVSEAASLLDATRRANATRIDAIVAERAAEAGWPDELARLYLGQLLRYGTGRRELDAVAEFYRRAHDLGLIERHRPIALNAPPLRPNVV